MATIHGWPKLRYGSLPTRGLKQKADMRELKWKEIDGVNYECRMMPATVAQKTLIRLGDVLGEPLVRTIASGFEGGLDSGLERVVDAGAMLLMSKLTPDSSDEIIKTLLDGVRPEGEGDLSNKKLFDEHFAGKIKTLYIVCMWSIQVNYDDFFVAARSSPALSGVLERADGALSALTAILKSGISSSAATTSTSRTSSPSSKT